MVYEDVIVVAPRNTNIDDVVDFARAFNKKDSI